MLFVQEVSIKEAGTDKATHQRKNIFSIPCKNFIHD